MSHEVCLLMLSFLTQINPDRITFQNVRKKDTNDLFVKGMNTSTSLEEHHHNFSLVETKGCFKDVLSIRFGVCLVLRSATWLRKDLE